MSEPRYASVNKVTSRISKLAVNQTKFKQEMSKKSIVVANDDKYAELVSKVHELDDKPYAFEGQMMLASSAYVFTIPNLSIKPREIAFISEELEDAVIVAAGNGYVVPHMHAAFENESDTSITIDDCVITRTQQQDGSWQLTLSFELYNQTHTDSPKRFQGGYTYTWLVLSHELYLDEE